MLEQSCDCVVVVDELEWIVLELGGKFKDSISFVGDLYWCWVDLKLLVIGKDEEVVFNECECGEDVVKYCYQVVLEKLLLVEIYQVIEC